MDKIIYATKDECLKAIETVKLFGKEPFPWMIEQLKAFKKLNQPLPS